MNTKKMIAVMAVLAMAVATFAFAPVVEDDAADKEIVYMNGDVTSTLTGTTNQLVIIDKDLTIKEHGTVIIEGDLLIKEGVTVTIEDGTVYIDPDSKYAYEGIFTIGGNATIDGNIISKKVNGLDIEPLAGNTVTINGTVTALGDTSGTPVKSATLVAAPVATDSKDIIVNGAVSVGTNAEVLFAKVKISADAVFTVLGIANGSIITVGTVNFDGATKSTATPSGVLEIMISDASAVINVVSVEGTITVSDKYMYAYAFGGVQYYVGAVPLPIAQTSGGVTVAAVASEIKANAIELTNISNIVITEKITTEIEYDETTSANKMTGKTEMIVAPIDADKAVEKVGTSAAAIATASGDIKGETIYFKTMTITDIEVYIASKVTIVGDVTVTYQIPTFTVAGILDVTGCLHIVKKGIVSTGTVIAAHYVVKDADNNVDHYYTTLQKAIDNGATDITMMGQLVIEKDLTVPAGVKLATDPALNITPAVVHDYCPVFVKEDATLTIANGAQFDAKGDLDIEGTFVIENIDYGIKLKGIWADVQMKDGSYEMYTNIYNAFAKAEAGAELNAYNPINAKIVLDKDLTIPAGMTFSNEGVLVYSDYAKMKGIEVGKAVTLTVAGKLIIDAPDKLVAESSFGTEPTEVSGGEVTENAVVKIGPQGLIQFDDANGTAVQGADIYESKRIAGAYFNDSPSKATDMKLCISNIPLALAGILDANDNYVKIYGEVEISDIKVAGTEKDRAMVTLSQYADVIMKNFTFVYASVTAEAGAKLTGDIGTATGKMILNKASVVVEATFNEIFVNDSMNLEVSGLIKSDNATEIAGIVYLKGFAYSILSESGSPEYKILTYAEKKFLVPAGTVAFVEGEVTFFGDVELHIAGEFTVMRDAFLYSMGNTSVTGTLTIDKVDGHAGTALFPVMYIGGTTDSFGDYVAGPAGNALVTGAGSVSSLNKQIIYLFNGATVSADVLNDWMDDAKSIQFYVDGSVWMTAYCGMKLEAAFASYDPVNDTTTYNAVPVFDNAKFNSWQTYDEKTNTYADVIPDKENEGIYYAVVGDARYDKVYANIDRSIYDVTIIADKGIDDIFIDGKIILKDKTSNTFTEKVSAGTHTISYTLANGYSGNASIVAIDGKIISGSGLTFVIDDDKAGADMKMEITVSGIEKSGYDTDPETHDEKATGLTTTEILLIVVVVIIAIMAVVLILRLNRS